MEKWRISYDDIYGYNLKKFFIYLCIYINMYIVYIFIYFYIHIYIYDGQQETNVYYSL